MSLDGFLLPLFCELLLDCLVAALLRELVAESDVFWAASASPFAFEEVSEDELLEESVLESLLESSLICVLIYVVVAEKAFVTEVKVKLGGEVLC